MSSWTRPCCGSKTFRSPWRRQQAGHGGCGAVAGRDHAHSRCWSGAIKGVEGGRRSSPSGLGALAQLACQDTREYGAAAEQNLRAALQLDNTNVYANAMLGNWMLQNRGNFPEAIGHLNTAVATGNARPLVRRMQVGGLLNDEVPGARAELVKAVNDMRKNGEAMDDEEKNRVRSFCYSTSASHQTELTESLSAVPKDDAWKTFLWLDDNREDRIWTLGGRLYLRESARGIGRSCGGA